MDEPYNFKNQLLEQQLKKHRFLRRTLQFFISISLLSLLLCFPSTFSLFPKSFIFYINTGAFSFLAHTLERKYMFLICNGILAILAKSSVSSTTNSSSAFETNDIVDEGQLASTTPGLSSMNASATVDHEEVPLPSSVESREDIAVVTNEEQEKEGKEMKAEGGKETRKDLGEVDLITGEGDREEESGVWPKQEEVEEEAEAAGGGIEANEELASTEELNRRIEEFIRKMKEEIRIEAQQQLIAV